VTSPIKFRSSHQAMVDQISTAPNAKAATLDSRLPAVCDVSVTNVCNAACDFCGFARDKTLVGPRRHLDADGFAQALPILYRRGIRFVTLQGGEPLVHPDIVRLVAEMATAGMQSAIITNGWFLPRDIEALADAGLRRLIISIDSADLSEHENNRGLDGLAPRIRQGIAQAHARGLPVSASVTINRLVRYDELPHTLRYLGFDSVGFSYPRSEPFGSTSLVYSAESHLVDLTRDELLDALRAIGRLKKRFPVFNSTTSLVEVERFIRGEQQYVPCVGGYKYFYLDWNLDIWRCEAWHEPLGSVFDFDHIPDQRDACNACMMACYRNASMLMHAGIAATDAVAALARGNIAAAAGSLFRRSVGLSLWALIQEASQIRRLARHRSR
jgi:MoaA/NifB/PqqE/SkfB family radical SAM enzyme